MMSRCHSIHAMIGLLAVAVGWFTHTGQSGQSEVNYAEPASINWASSSSSSSSSASAALVLLVVVVVGFLRVACTEPYRRHIIIIIIIIIIVYSAACHSHSHRYRYRYRLTVLATNSARTEYRQTPVPAIPWGSWGPDPLSFWQWGSKCAWTPTFSAMLLYMACNP